MADRERNRLTMVGLVVAIAVVLGTAGNARAQGFYAGAGLGVTDMSLGIWGPSHHAETNTLFVGYELPEYVGFEAAWIDLGSHEGTRVEDAWGTLHTEGWTAAVTGRIPIVEWFGLYGRVGTFFWRTRFDSAWSWDPQTTRDHNGKDLFWGVGVRFTAKKVGFLGEYARYRTGSLDDHKAFSFAVRYTF